MAFAQHPIQLASRLSGLSMHVIRIWEQRHKAVEPERTETNRRLYSPQQIDRLILLKDLTQSGYSISQVAQLTDEALRKLAAESCKRGSEGGDSGVKLSADGYYLDECLSAIRALDRVSLEDAFKRAETGMGALGVLHRLFAPLTQVLGELWRAGEITSAHEHFATGVIRVWLGNAAKPFGGFAQAPVLIVATPAGQVHEMGALLVAATAVNFGWRVTYLGASLPAAEIAGAARIARARAVALSVVYPEDDPQLGGELESLRDSLDPETALIVGGRASSACGASLEKIGALRIEGLASLGSVLDGLRKPHSSRSRAAG